MLAVAGLLAAALANPLELEPESLPEEPDPSDGAP